MCESRDPVGFLLAVWASYIFLYIFMLLLTNLLMCLSFAINSNQRQIAPIQYWLLHISLCLWLELMVELESSPNDEYSVSVMVQPK